MGKSLDDMMRADAKAPAEDKLEAIREVVSKRRDLDNIKYNLEQRLTQVNKEIADIDHRKLPDMFVEAGVDRVDIPGHGNAPPYSAVLSDYYKASIRVGWPPETRAAAFQKLEDLGLGDIVKSQVVVQFAREEAEARDNFINMLNELAVPYTEQRDVAWATLTAAVKELYESGRQLTAEDLDAIGAQVGKIVKLKHK